ncbi:lysylphosphatidylglycerol synthase transmembrane domain-containing protein [Deferrisoma camini]|uniref:lysylphosphatidylglycerol synthase transmembrane domain-containing protein n=1 Tax=Deferrisoma camini TaxID=1035120 RepID=UPI00046D5A8B|nr:flippase-like domain-containing protein [Deferrisoma camini]
MVRRAAASLLVLGILLWVVLFFLGDLERVGLHLSSLRPLPLALAVGATVLSYLCGGFSLAALLQALGIRLPLGRTLRVAFFATALNYLVSFGGIGGVGLRLALFHREGLHPSDNALVSLLHTALMNAVLLMFVAVGFGVPVATGELPWRRAVSHLALVGFSLAALSVLVGAFLNPSLRRRVLGLGFRAYRWIGRRLRIPPLSDRMQEETLRRFDRTARWVRAHPGGVLGAFVWVAGEWGAALGCLAFSFCAVGRPVAASPLLAGYAIGIFAGAAAFTPGGIGFVEGGMTAVFVSMGVPLETALAAVLVYRFVYYVLPLALALAWLGPATVRRLARVARGHT